MNRLLFILFLFALNAGAQPLWRAPWTTNVPPALISVNDANGGGITNIGANGAHYGLWHFYGNDSNTIARLGDLTSGGGAGGESNATYLVLGLTNALPNAHRLLSDMATILQLTNGSDIIHRVSLSLSNWGNFSTNAISDTASNIVNAVGSGKISIQGGAGNNNILTNLTLQNSASVFSPNAGATFPFGIGQSGNDLVFSHPDTTDQILMTATGLVANGSAVTNLPTSLTNATHYDLTAGTKGLKTWSAGNGITLTNEAGSNLVAAINPAVVASQANLTAASNTLQSSISDLQGSTNGLNTRVGNLEGSSNLFYNGEVSLTNATKIGLVYDRNNGTNRLRSISSGNGLVNTNESTNVSFAIDPAIVASQTDLNAASNTLQSSISAASSPKGATNFALNNITNYGLVSYSTNLIKEGWGGGATGAFKATNFIDFSTNGLVQWLTFTNDIIWLFTTNRPTAGHQDIEVWFQPSHFFLATNRQIIFMPSWNRISAASTNTLISNKFGILRLRSTGNGPESDVFASWDPTL